VLHEDSQVAGDLEQSWAAPLAALEGDHEDHAWARGMKVRPLLSEASLLQEFGHWFSHELLPDIESHA
jgi:hypothetical protein